MSVSAARDQRRTPPGNRRLRPDRARSTAAVTMRVMAPGGTSAGAETTFCVARAGVSRRIGASAERSASATAEREGRQDDAGDGIADGEYARRHAERDGERLRHPPGGMDPDGLHPHRTPRVTQLAREGERGAALGVGAGGAARFAGGRVAHAAGH